MFKLPIKVGTCFRAWNSKAQLTTKSKEDQGTDVQTTNRQESEHNFADKIKINDHIEDLDSLY